MLLAQNRVNMNIHRLTPLQHRLPRTAFISHAELQQNGARTRVALEVSGEYAIQLESLKPIAHDLARRLGRIAFTPERNTNPITQLGALVFHVGMQSNSTNQAPIAAQPNGQAKFIPLRHGSNEFAGVLFVVRIRNSQSCVRHFARSDERNQLRDIGLYPLPKDQAGSLKQDWHDAISAHRAGKNVADQQAHVQIPASASGSQEEELSVLACSCHEPLPLANQEENFDCRGWLKQTITRHAKYLTCLPLQRKMPLPMIG